ncbi:MAG TPA: tripartite tricarboxylate transporter substrate binding protein [Quisquiliibacterium sp.]|nr:tripartite tricarboxylate transporter substrate binding protein [Quisquiliibacterium sp.]HQP67244.1 tripartite tricarboxylate transporter substrate binding protein [Quisquiliibacterium sp.]
MNTRRHLILAAGASALAAQLPATALAQTFPSRPLRFIMPYPPGGSSEILARPIAQEMTKFFGQPVIVDFKPGAGSTIGADTVAKSPPDGHTVVMMLSAHAINATLMPKLPYDTVKDFAPVTLVATLPLVVVVPAASPIRSIADLVAAARAQPGKLNFASAGNGNTSHLSVEYFKSMLGLNMTHVPYKGSGPAIIGLLGSEVDFMFDSLSSSLTQIKAGKFRAIAVTTAKRSRILPDVPTIAESGVPGLAGFDVSVWYAVLAAAGTPAPIIQKLNGDFIRALRAPEAKEKIEAAGYDIVGSTPEHLDAFIRSEIVRWGKVVKDSGATIN